MTRLQNLYQELKEKGMTDLEITKMILNGKIKKSWLVYTVVSFTEMHIFDGLSQDNEIIRLPYSVR